jgi:hypothetical protein
LDQISEERSLDFYCKSSFRTVSEPDSLRSGDFLLTGSKDHAMADTAHFTKIYQGDGFHVSTLSLPFLKPASRKKEIHPYWLLQKR